MFLCKQARRNPKQKVVIKQPRQPKPQQQTTTQYQLRDFYEVHEPDIHSTQWREIFFKNYGADQPRLHISELHFDMFTTPRAFSCWTIRFKTELCSCSNFSTEALLWIKEVEMVNSVDDLKSSCFIQGFTPFPDFELLDTKMASALIKIMLEFLLKEEGRSGGTECSESRPIPQVQADRLLDLRLIPGHWRQRFRTRFCRLICGCSSE